MDTRGKRYGVVSVDQQRTMSGLEFVQGLVTGALPLNSMAETLGYDIVEASSGHVAITAEPTAAHRNPAGTVHGGLAATLLDSCMGLAVHSTLDKGFGQTTVEFKISLLRVITPETGLAATLLDSCMGLAIHSTLDKGVGQTTVEFKISLLRTITPETGLVRAEGRVISRGRRIGTAEGRLTDAEGRLLAHGTTTCLIFEYQSA